MPGEIERRDYRHFPSTVEVRAFRDSDGQAHIAGTGIVFGSRSVDLGGFVEVIDPGADIQFREDLVSLFNHNPDHVLGRVPQTMKVERTKAGIIYDVTPPAGAALIVELIERGDVRGNSFQFRVLKDRWETISEGVELRTILGMAVQEMGPVVFPAYQETDVSVAMRSRDRALALPDGLSAADRRLRELGLLG